MSGAQIRGCGVPGASRDWAAEHEAEKVREAFAKHWPGRVRAFLLGAPGRVRIELRRKGAWGGDYGVPGNFWGCYCRGNYRPTRWRCSRCTRQWRRAA